MSREIDSLLLARGGAAWFRRDRRTLTFAPYANSANSKLDSGNSDSGPHHDPTRPDVHVRDKVAPDVVPDQASGRDRTRLGRNGQTERRARGHALAQARLRNRKDQAARREPARSRAREHREECDWQLQERRRCRRTMMVRFLCFICNNLLQRYLGDTAAFPTSSLLAPNLESHPPRRVAFGPGRLVGVPLRLSRSRSLADFLLFQFELDPLVHEALREPLAVFAGPFVPLVHDVCHSLVAPVSASRCCCCSWCWCW